jgi:hypothetical protein
VLILVGLLPTTANAGSVVNECKTGAECVDLGFKNLSALKSSCLTPLPSSYINPRLEQPRPAFKPHALYEKGKGVKQDDFKALKFHQKACDLNDGNGCFNLGLSYEEGKGVFAFFIHKSKIRATIASI